MSTTETSVPTRNEITRRGIELTPGRLLPGGIWEINPMPPEDEMHPDDRLNPIGA